MMNKPGSKDVDLRQNRTPPPSVSIGGPGGGSRRSPATSFPACACKALTQVEKAVAFTLYPSVMASLSQKAAVTANRMRDLQTCLDQDLFCLGPDRHTSRLNPLRELRQLEMICAFFQEKQGHKDSYMYFDAIFCGREGESLPHEARISILVKTSVLAVQYPDCSGLLSDVATWLQKVGLTKPYGSRIVATLVQEYCTQDSADLHCYLYPMIDTSPSFAPYFFSLSVGVYELYQPIPLKLLEICAKWMAENPKPLIKPLVEQKTGSANSLPRLIIQAFWKLEMFSVISRTSGAEINNKIHYGILNVLLTIPELKTQECIPLITDEGMCSALEKISEIRSHLRHQTQITSSISSCRSRALVVEISRRKTDWVVICV